MFLFDKVVTDALVNPPVPGDPSYDCFQEEMTAVILSLRRKARLVYQRMNSIPGIQCNEIQGSMEAFPRVDIPHEAWDDARVSTWIIYMYSWLFKLLLEACKYTLIIASISWEWLLFS